MIFGHTSLDGLFAIEAEKRIDDRGYFARTWCLDEFYAHGLELGFTQCSTSFNRRRGTLRGLHYQAAPHAEAKLVRCTTGRLFDVAVDLRPDSPTRGRWHAEELSADNCCMLYIPAGFAHGFQTLEDETELFYQISEPYHAEAARGVRWDDPDLAIAWPLADPILSPRDRALPPLAELQPLEEAAPCL